MDWSDTHPTKDSRIRSDYERYRVRYEKLRDDLERRDRQAQTDPLLLQRWPIERRVFSDRLKKALMDWELFGHKSELESSEIDHSHDASESHKISEYEKYRGRYERLRDDLEKRDQQAQTDPFRLQRWPLERKVFADRVEAALDEWETRGYKMVVEAQLRPSERRRDRNFDPKHPADDDRDNPTPMRNWNC